MKNTHAQIILGVNLYLGNILCAQSSLQGTSSGIFANPDGPTGAVSTGEGTSTLSWGNPIGPTDSSSSLSFTGQIFHLSVDQIGQIGRLTFTNGEIFGDSGIESIDLDLTLDLTSLPAQSIKEPFTLGLSYSETTTNGDSSMDLLKLLTPYGGIRITEKGETLALRLFFGNTTSFAVSELEQVSLFKGQTAEINVNAVLCQSLPLPNTASSFTFAPVSGSLPILITGEGTNFITTGESDQPTEYEIFGATLTELRTEIPFTAGALRYFNGTTATATAADSATINIDLGEELGAFSFDLEFVLTVNTDDVRESADIIRIVNPISKRRIEIEGIPHVARILFSNPETGGFTNVSQFAVAENVSASADVVLILTRFLPQMPPIHLSLSKPNPTQILLSWKSIVGSTYQVETSINLVEFTPDGAKITANDGAIILTKGISEPRKFYRVIEIIDPS